MAHDLTVWGVGTPRTMRVHWMLLELGLDYECHPIQSRTGETLTDEFRRLNPRHKIPVLRHGVFVLTESAAILQYLGETFANSQEVYVPSEAAVSLSHATQGEPAMLATDVQSELKVQPVINGAKHALAVDVRTSLLDLLRERLHLTGTKKVATTAPAGHARF